MTDLLEWPRTTARRAREDRTLDTPMCQRNGTAPMAALRAAFGMNPHTMSRTLTELQLARKVRRWDHTGDGSASGTRGVQAVTRWCDDCQGEGQVEVVTAETSGHPVIEAIDCQPCEGTGVVPTVPV